MERAQVRGPDQPGSEPVQLLHLYSELMGILIYTAGVRIPTSKCCWGKKKCCWEQWTEILGKAYSPGHGQEHFLLPVQKHFSQLGHSLDPKPDTVQTW